MDPAGPTKPWLDVRLVGFTTRVELEVAHSRLDAMLSPLTTEPVPVAEALGRVPANAVMAPADRPHVPRAWCDGYAVTAAATFGASAYNPLELSSAHRVVAGDPLPPGTDAVLPFSAAIAADAVIEVTDAIVAGDGIEATGDAWRRGTTVAPAGQALTFLALARAAAAGLRELDVRRRPKVRIVVPGPKRERGAADALLLMLGGLVGRDGGAPVVAAPSSGIAAALRDGETADLVLVAGRSGTGPDDAAAPALAEVGSVEAHGIAIAPGGSAGMGRVGRVPVILLPGQPLACLAAYELLAGPALRQLAGLAKELPHPRRRLRLGAKIASQVGTTELWLVRRDADGVVPLAPPDRAVLADTALALGFVLVSAGSEGHQAGSEVEVHLLDHGHG